MTIASEITDLQNNLAAAKAAVTAKGGTVGDTGLAGLASEIASIPSGGSLTDYGSIKYLDGNNVEQTLTLATATDFFELTLGGSGSDITINSVTINKNNITEVTVADGVMYLPNNFCYGCNFMTKATLPSSILYIGNGVFSYTTINNELTLTNVEYIGNDFMRSNSQYNQPTNLPKIVNIGSNFLGSCTSYNSALSLGNSLKAIDQRFLYGCTSFAQNLTLPSSIEYTIGSYFMYNCKQFVGPLVCNSNKVAADNNTLSTNDNAALMYTTGVTLTGAYAQSWKDTFPDRTSSPYRNLIIGS